MNQKEINILSNICLVHMTFKAHSQAKEAQVLTFIISNYANWKMMAIVSIKISYTTNYM